MISQADAIDHAVQDAYGRRGRAAASFLLSWAGWVIGTVEVYVILQLLQFPVGWGDALMLESLGQSSQYFFMEIQRPPTCGAM